MKNLKRILCTILSLILMFSALSCISFAKESKENEITGAEYRGIMKVLEIADYEDEALKEYITRAEFYKLAAIISGTPIVESDEKLFSDMDLENEYEVYAKSLVKFGVISTDKDKKIFPDDKISVVEASSIILKLAGYSVYADAKGGYPSGYHNVAKLNGLLKGLGNSPTTALTKGETLKLLFNALELPVMAQKKYGTNVGYEPAKSGTFLKNVFGMSHLEAVVDGVDLSRLTGENDIDVFYIEAGGRRFSILDYIIKTEINVYDFLGYNAHIYYHQESSDVPKICYIEKSEDNNENVIDISDISYISGKTIKAYVENNKIRSYVLKPSAPIIYNGTSTKKRLDMSLINKTITVGNNTYTEKHSGNIRILDNNNDGTYDVVFIDIFENYVVKEKDGKNRIIYDKFTGKQLVIDEKSDDPYVLIYKNGVSTDIGDVSVDDVVSVYKTETGDAYQNYIRGYVNTSEITGTIERIRNGGKIFDIEGISYELNPEVRLYQKGLIAPGVNVKAKLDISGKVAHLEIVTDSAIKYGFLIAGDMGEGLSGGLKLKIFTDEADFITVDVASKFKLDGIHKQNDDTKVIDYLHTVSKNYFDENIPAECIASMVRYRFDTAGAVNMIDTFMTVDSDGSLKKSSRNDVLSVEDSFFSVVATDAYYYTPARNFNGKVALEEETKFFIYPDAATQDVYDYEFYEVRTVADTLVSQYKYTLRGFYSDKDKFLTNVCGIKANEDNIVNQYNGPSGFSVVSDKYQVLDENTNKAIDCIMLKTGNGDFELKIKEGFAFESVANDNDSSIKDTMGFDDLKIGDVVVYKADLKGYAVGGRFLYRADTKLPGISPKSSSHYLKKGYIYAKSKEGFYLYLTDSDDKSLLKNVTYDDCELYTFTNSTIFCYSLNDKGNPRVEGGTNTSLKSYIATGGDCSQVLLFSYQSAPYSIFIWE